MKMKIKYWGVRGSIPSPSINGFNTGKYGGNTSCIEITTDGKDTYILDAGTGIRLLGLDMMKRGNIGKQKAKILLSHVHWDHIQGFPFFTPAFIPGNEYKLYGEKKDTKFKSENGDIIDYKKSLEETLRGQQQYPNFPVTLEQMASKMSFYDLEEGKTLENGVTVSYTRLNHPNGVFSYKFEENEKKFVYATDTEHDPETNTNQDLGKQSKKVAEWAENAEILVYDGQYTPEEYNPKEFNKQGMPKIGWGHSTYAKGIDIALKANVKSLVLFHHDPLHDDRQLDEIQEKAFEYLKKMNSDSKLRVILAYEGLEQIM
jgi:phosphoribosyl 1,2-cyclic phosphodiesterase